MSTPVKIAYSPYQFVGPHTTVSSLSSVAGVGLPSGANALLIQAVSQNVRITFDGQPPTASHGFQIRAGDPPTLLVLMPGGSLQAIQETASASLEVQGVSQPV